MTSGRYLYGDKFDASILKTMLYPVALMTKNIWANELLDDLNKENYMSRDLKRISDVLKAIRFNNNLLNEIYEKDTE